MVLRTFASFGGYLGSPQKLLACCKERQSSSPGPAAASGSPLNCAPRVRAPTSWVVAKTVVPHLSCQEPCSPQPRQLKRFDLMVDINLRVTYVCRERVYRTFANAPNPHLRTLSTDPDQSHFGQVTSPKVRDLAGRRRTPLHPVFSHPCPPVEPPFCYFICAA